MISQNLQKLISRAEQSVHISLNNYANSTDPKKVKKAKLLSYWLKDYMRMIKKEDTFDPSALKKYKRGDILQAHLGFNIGSEEGGLHYVIVVSKFNASTSDTLTVIPLTSKKENYKENNYNVDLGNTIFDQLTNKYSNARKKLNADLNSCSSDYKKYSDKRNVAMKEFFSLEPNSEEGIRKAEELSKYFNILNDLTNSMEKLRSDLNTLKKMEDEISHLKLGSIALVGQITTISKIRIYNPLNRYDTLTGIKLSPSELDLIDIKVKELFTK